MWIAFKLSTVRWQVVFVEPEKEDKDKTFSEVLIKHRVSVHSIMWVLCKLMSYYRPRAKSGSRKLIRLIKGSVRNNDKSQSKSVSIMQCYSFMALVKKPTHLNLEAVENWSLNPTRRSIMMAKEVCLANNHRKHKN